MANPPLAEVREKLKVQWYRSRLDPARFRELSRSSDAKGWFQAAGHLLLFVLTGTAVYLAWSQSSWAWFFIALFAHGTIGSFFVGTAVHELGHGTVFRTKWLNRAFLYIYCLLCWWNPFDFASSHTYHHRYTLHPEGDRENLLPLHPNVGRTFLLQLFTINILTQPGRTFGKGGLISTIRSTFLDAMGRTGPETIPANEWLAAIREDQPKEHRRGILFSRLQIAFHGIVLILSLVSGLWVLPLILSVFPFIANWLSYFVSLPQHCGLKDNVTDFRKCTRSIQLRAFVEFLYWHMNWHTEHHMYAGVPCYNLAALHEEIKEDVTAPKGLIGAWAEMLDIWERQKTDPDYQFDTPLPATAKLKRERPAPVEASIGDLAPETLS